MATTFREVITSIPGLTHYYPLNADAKDAVGDAHGIIRGNVKFDGTRAVFDGKSSIELPDRDDFSAAGTASKALTIIVFQTVDDWKRESPGNEYVHWMGKGKSGAHEWTFRYYIDGGGGEAPARPRRTSFYHFNPAGGLGAGSFFQDPDAAGVERVVGGMIWGNSSNGGSTQMWKNGVVRDTDALSGYSVNPKNTGTPVFLGSRGDGTGFLVGRLRRVAFFNRRLTADEMKRIYDARALPEGTTATVPVIPPAPETPPAAGNNIVVGSRQWPIAGIDVARRADQLIVYTPAYGPNSATNAWGAEVAVSKGVAALVVDQQKPGSSVVNPPIPADGVVLSGHGTARTWLLANVTAGATVGLPSALIAKAEPEGEPPAVPGVADEAVLLRGEAVTLRAIADQLDATADRLAAAPEA